MYDNELAQILVCRFHDGQKYGEHDYTYHLSSVATSVATAYPDDPRLEVVAWLHDILEDTSCTEDTLRVLFEAEVVDAVVALTRKPGEKKEAYAARVKANAMAVKVKRHDSFCNLKESLMQGDMKRTAKYAEFVAVMAGW